MSQSTLYGIRGDLTGEGLREYENSWLFSPIVWNILFDKYVISCGMRHEGRGTGFLGDAWAWKQVNSELGNRGDMSDRICWELAAQMIFFTKDKGVVADAIRRFAVQNRGYCRSAEDGISSLERDNIAARFARIADDIEDLDETEHPHFVLKGNSCDDSVECWFTGYDEDANECFEASLADVRDCDARFVRIEGGRIVGWMSVTEFLSAVHRQANGKRPRRHESRKAAAHRELLRINGNRSDRLVVDSGCPFCGGIGVIGGPLVRYNGEWMIGYQAQVTCWDCLANVNDFGDTPEEAVENAKQKWRRRAYRTETC